MELGGVADRTGGDNGTLPLHQTGNRRDCADSPRVGQTDGGSFKIPHLQLSISRLVDQFGKSIEKFPEVHLVDRLDIGNDKMNFRELDRKSTRLNSSHVAISYAVFCLQKKNN